MCTRAGWTLLSERARPARHRAKPYHTAVTSGSFLEWLKTVEKHSIRKSLDAVLTAGAAGTKVGGPPPGYHPLVLPSLLYLIEGVRPIRQTGSMNIFDTYNWSPWRVDHPSALWPVLPVGYSVFEYASRLNLGILLSGILCL